MPQSHKPHTIFSIAEENIMANLKEKILEQIDFQMFYQNHLGVLPETNSNNEISVVCPFHTDSDPSLSINMVTGYYNCFGCDAKGDVFTFQEKIKGQPFSVAIHQMAEDLNITSNSSNNEKIHFDYKDKDGNVAYRIIRFDDGKGIPHRPDGSGGWIPGVKGHVELVPFNLPTLLDSTNDNKQIHICEGEPDAITLCDLNYLATTNALGAQNWKSEYNQYFAGRDVIIHEDNDQAGRDRSEKISGSLLSIAKSIKVIQYHELEEKGDVTDFLDSLSTASEMRKKMSLGAKIKATPYIKEPSKITNTDYPNAVEFLTINELLAVDYPPLKEIMGNGILPEGCGLMLAGEAKTGKSLISLEWALHLAIGKDLYDGLIPVPKKRKTIFFQAENPSRQVQFRNKRMMEGLGILTIDNSIFFTNRRERYNLLEPASVNKIIDTVKASGADVFVIDPLSSFHSVDENDNVKMRNVLDRITDISIATGASSIVIHHFGKPQDGRSNKDRTRGASSIQGWYDTHCSVTNKSHESKTLRTITFDPLRHGPSLRPILVERDEFFNCTPTESDSVVKTSDVVNILKDKFRGSAEGKITLIRAIQNAYDVSDSTAKRAIKEAQEMKVIKMVNGDNNKSKRCVLC